MLIINYFFISSITWRRRLITLNQGDNIHHPQHGIGEVQSIRKRSFSGENGAKFAKLFFKREELTLMMRVKDLTSTIRYPIGASEADKLINFLRTWKGKVSSQWKARANAHQKALEMGDPYGYAKVYLGLSRIKRESQLRATDRVHYNQSAELLSEELANALGKSQEEMKEELARTVQSQHGMFSEK